MTEISNSDDLIDSRDVDKYIESLEFDIEILDDKISDLETELVDTENESRWAQLEETIQEYKDEKAEIEAELKSLKDLREQCSNYGWEHGLALIRDSYFNDYARELAEDLHGDALRSAVWPFNCIDWDRAVRELQMDYSSVEFGDVTYWHDN